MTTGSQDRAPGGVLSDIMEEVLKPIAEVDVTVEDVCVGVFYTGVKLSTGHAGIAYTASEELPLEHAKRHSYMPRAGSLCSMSVHELASLAFSDNLLEAAAGLATINALAEMQYSRGWAGCRVVIGSDALQTFEVRSEDTVTMVGAFPFFIRELRGRVKSLYVTERNQAAFAGYPVVPAERQGEVLPISDIVLITAATLGNHTLDDVLALCSSAREIVVVGPTTPLCPGPLFRRGVTLVAGMHISDAQPVLRAVSEGGTGSHLSAECAVKVNLRSV